MNKSCIQPGGGARHLDSFLEMLSAERGAAPNTLDAYRRDLEDFLNRENYDPTQLILYDKIIGKASALMIVRLGIRKVVGGIVSKPAETVFKKWEVEYSSKKQIDYIDCRTEQILMDISDPEEVYQLIRVRAGLK